MIFPEGPKGRHKDDGLNLPESGKFGRTLLREACHVLKWAPELADGVLTGAVSLDSAYAAAEVKKANPELAHASGSPTYGARLLSTACG